MALTRKRNSPLRYPGGKSKIIPLIEEIIVKNNLSGCNFVEPFAGGAGVSLYLMSSKTVKNIYINDLDYGIYSFWHSVFNDTENLVKKINEVSVNLDEWKKQKILLNENKKLNLLESGFNSFFLNRTNISGIISAGPIGGLNQKGNWKIDCRFNKKNLSKQIYNLANNKNVKVYNLEYSDFYKEIKDVDNKFSFIDPPYYKQGKGLYNEYFNHQDHVDLAEFLFSLNEKWILSYDNVKEINSIFSKFNKFEFSINYSVYNKVLAKEIMFYNGINI